MWGFKVADTETVQLAFVPVFWPRQVQEDELPAMGQEEGAPETVPALQKLL